MGKKIMKKKAIATALIIGLLLAGCGNAGGTEQAGEPACAQFIGG